MPGFLVLESAAQSACALLSQGDCGKIGVLTGVEKARFRAQVIPGVELSHRVEIERFRHAVETFRAESFVGEKKVAEATFSFAMLDRKNP